MNVGYFVIIQTFELALWASKGICPAHALTYNSISKLSLILSAWLASHLSPRIWCSGPSNQSFSTKPAIRAHKLPLADLFIEHFTIRTMFSSFLFEPLNLVKQVREMIVQFYTWGNSQSLWLASWWPAPSEHKIRCPECSPPLWCERNVFLL